MGKLSNLTPGMRQYMEIKNKHPDCVVLFRMGDFYETFYQDAKTVSREVEITLTARGKGEKKAPLAGIPYHSAQPYIAKLVRKGYKVCIVEQTEDPKKAKGLVKRDVVRIVTPGTVIDDIMLPGGANNYIMAINKEKEKVAMAFADISTGEFNVVEISEDKVDNELSKYGPSEIIIPLSLENSDFAKSISGFFVNSYDDYHFFEEKATEKVNNHFNAVPEMSILAISCCASLLDYLSETQKNDLSHINQIRFIRQEDYMLIDRATISNLNIISNNKDNDASLLFVIDKTSTSMGKRLLRQWVLKPLLDKDAINSRLDAVEELCNDVILKDRIATLISEIYDIERLMTRVSFKTASPKDLNALSSSLSVLPGLNELLDSCSSLMLKEKVDEFKKLKELIYSAIKDEPNTIVREGNIIRKGYDQELDEIRLLKSDTRKWMLEFEEKEKKKTGIKYLKVKFNKVFGYFIEVSKSNLHLVPEDYIRKQTQVNSERFITSELKEKENIILTADEKICQKEYDLFMDVIEKVLPYSDELKRVSGRIAMIDVLCSFSAVSSQMDYSRPEINDGYGLEIKEGRHAIVEVRENGFVPNDLIMDESKNMMIITGPNMAGKSVYIKQNALIVLLAQIGCFVPAEKASIGVVDRIFSRVGASDDISSGHSTFMVEMKETANILSNATDRSFIILDEIGRGTSTYDGVSLAWAIAEYIINDIKAKTLFATHYHQLNKIEQEYDCVHNYNIAVSEKDDGIVFLRKIIEGGTDKSYGIHVAKLAGVPSKVIENSRKIIKQLEMDDEIGSMIHKKLKKENEDCESVVKNSDENNKDGKQKRLDEL